MNNVNTSFWKQAGPNLNRDEFYRRRCQTAAEREAAINKILGITPQERIEVVPEKEAPEDPTMVAPCGPEGCPGCDASISEGCPNRDEGVPEGGSHVAYCTLL